MAGSFKLALCQMDVIKDKNKNIEKAVEMLQKAAEGRADIAVLPEMFSCYYSSKMFRANSEELHNSRTIEIIAQKALEYNMYIVAGSIAEMDGEKIYNTSVVLDRQGKMIGRHRKIHLFDIDIPGKITFMESEVLSPGNNITVIDTEFCKIGIAVCYDLRFPELLRLMALEGAKIMIIPAAFNMVTGPAHWEMLIRTRAMDNQVYLAAASPARNNSSSYVAYANSMIASPWGSIIGRAGEDEEVLFADINLSEVERIRNELPLLKHRRTDLYKLYSTEN